MIDFVSTRDKIDVETVRCARLLAAIIAQAIRDAARKPTKDEKKFRRSHKHAYLSMTFLFEPHGAFDVYAGLIGLDAESVRVALLSRRRLSSSSHVKHLFNEQDRRIIQMRHAWFIRDKTPLKKITFREENDEEDDD